MAGRWQAASGSGTGVPPVSFRLAQALRARPKM